MHQKVLIDIKLHTSVNVSLNMATTDQISLKYVVHSHSCGINPALCLIHKHSFEVVACMQPLIMLARFSDWRQIDAKMKLKHLQ